MQRSSAGDLHGRRRVILKVNLPMAFCAIFPLFEVIHIMAETAAMPNGEHNAMPLTEYSASPLKNEAAKTNASTAIPPEYLLSDGHPDV